MRKSFCAGGAHLMIPVIDVFAGPGGLGEGFASLGRKKDRQKFKGYLSIEKGLGCAPNSETSCIFSSVLQVAGAAALLRRAPRTHFARALYAEFLKESNLASTEAIRPACRTCRVAAPGA